MIKINCAASDSIKLTDLVSFQGNLKKRTDDDIAKLSESLVKEGLMMPFAVWKNGDENLLLDGHGRKEALIRLAASDADILTADWPVVYVSAETEQDARRALLQITSSYGKITKAGYKQFCVSIPGYVAPSISKFVAKPSVAEGHAGSSIAAKLDGFTLVKIKVLNEKVEDFKNIIKECCKFAEVI
ncbi:hypothetical protein HDR60_03110 [bacterium]|nr:hypothetical protein [bacterium]